MTDHTKTIVESNNFIVLDKYIKETQAVDSYQTEADLERELIQDLTNQGYDFLSNINNAQAMLNNVREQLQLLNNVHFLESEWTRFVETYLDKSSDSIVDKTRKIHDDYIHDFVFDDGRIQNIYLLDKKNIARNKVQVIKQFEQKGNHTNRYDVTILVNGLPLVQVELKKRGMAIREAFNQVHRYSKESFNSENSLYKYLQLFVISNGTDTRYFANTTARNKNSFDFTMNWAKSDNSLIKDLKDFTATFFQKNTLLNVLLNYTVFDVSDTLLVMRPYQIAATERILWKVKSSFEAKTWSQTSSGGFIWHTTGSGKTLTSFKAARLATELDFIDKVFFVVDRKDLDYQTMKEYQRFSPDSVNGSESTAGLKRNLEKDDNKIIVTTIQKLNILMKTENDLPIYNKQVMFIFDECHRSQFGEAQKNLKKKFKKFYQFGFTGTPIFPENKLGNETTASVFGTYDKNKNRGALHAYVITDAIRDEKVLKFKVDYNDVRPQFKNIEKEQDIKKLSAYENKQALLHPDRIREISQYILTNFRQKTHRLQVGSKGFNAMFAVSSVDAAKLYYECLKDLQKNSDKPLKIATIFSFTANEEQDAVGDIQDESFDVSAMNSSAKEFLSSAIADYNAIFKTNFSVETKSFQNYYRDLAKQVKAKEIDLLIVVGMFLTGFDAPTINTLFVDKNLRYHGLIQAYSRTNRIFDATKTFGNIVTFRDLEQPTIDAIRLFGDANTQNIVLEKSYEEYMDGFTDVLTGEARRGYTEVVKELEQRFPNPDEIFKESDKKAFAKLFGEYLKVENVLQNYDEYASLKELQTIDLNDANAVEEFKNKHYLNDEELAKLTAIDVPAERKIQDYRSSYNDIRDWLRRERLAEQKEESKIDWNDVVFEVDLLKSQEINLDYILELIFESNKKIKDKIALVDDMRRVIRSSLESRSKESLIVDFINHTDLDKIEDKASVMDSFYTFAQIEQQREVQELIRDENLNEDATKRYIMTSLKREFASENGTELNAILPKMSPLNPLYLTKKQSVYQKIAILVEKFKGVGGNLK
ncbi:MULTISPECIES: type I restriction endonuclease subunit R [Acinetobacter calcoaceticus/baumannii complex]|uniref:Type I restriction enzyme endonuclease subunit n=3 Tax=Acinetobacter calcoaceticus/baumannii complex TaxID=909768 RepID=A0A241ZHT9_ACIBA|nr:MULTISPECIES: type I restriction endonuclease subunit R [Acinetobacter calcoaceticus/baumannii complex]ENW55860.1 type I restriction enzyme EcoR124II R protein [Acinetobacter baumannii NIPH 70]ENW74835.1 type I restriction enzyme EcoR124II R protein [Acinetobacter baumannii NIPH 80]KQF73706.1 DEAD/DEAH box helicase [Acinetobacter baumannii]MBF6767302.1 type I restriction endonuclease subunit R [Acinetobacter baumannii]MCB5209500.1 type I restriction endonuclease subunit R [Acinetobacter bau